MKQTLDIHERAMAALYETSLAISSQTDLDTLLKSIVEQATRLLGARMGCLYLMEPDAQSLRLTVSHNFPGNYVGVKLKLGEGASGRVAQSGEVLMVADHQEWEGRSAVFANAPFRRVLAIPLKRKKQVIGVINITDTKKTGLFSAEEVRLASLFADQAAIAIENARLFAESSRHLEQLATLNRVGMAITSGLDMSTVAKTIFEQCQKVVQADAFYLALYDAENGVISFPIFYDRGEYRDVGPHDIQTRPGLTGIIIRKRKTLYIPDTLDPKIKGLYPMIRTGGEPARSFVGVPLTLGEKIIGVISIQSYQADVYDAEHVHLLETIAAQAAVAVENAHLYDKAQRQAIIDELTALYNYRGLMELGPREVERARRFQRPLSALFFDIDHFREFNNRYSHGVGNEVLKAVAKCCLSNLRTVDLLARYGGEEFVALLPETDLPTAHLAAERLRLAIENLRVPTEWGELGITISIGASEFNPEMPDLAALIDRANKAEHLAKELGRNRVVII